MARYYFAPVLIPPLTLRAHTASGANLRPKDTAWSPATYRLYRLREFDLTCISTHNNRVNSEGSIVARLRRKLDWQIGEDVYKDKHNNYFCNVYVIKENMTRPPVDFVIGVSREFLEEADVDVRNETQLKQTIIEFAHLLTQTWTLQSRGILTLLRFNQFNVTGRDRFKRILTREERGNLAFESFMEMLASGEWHDPYAYLARTEEWAIKIDVDHQEVVLFKPPFSDMRIELHEVPYADMQDFAALYEIGVINEQALDVRHLDEDFIAQLRSYARRTA